MWCLIGFRLIAFSYLDKTKSQKKKVSWMEVTSPVSSLCQNCRTACSSKGRQTADVLIWLEASCLAASSKKLVINCINANYFTSHYLLKIDWKTIFQSSMQHRQMRLLLFFFFEMATDGEKESLPNRTKQTLSKTFSKTEREAASE
jgi:hypothetical protein